MNDFITHTVIWKAFCLCSNVFQCFLCALDDGKLSFDEFNAYFADGILTTDELQELFYSIDGRQNKWVTFSHGFCLSVMIIDKSFVYICNMKHQKIGLNRKRLKARLNWSF